MHTKPHTLLALLLLLFSATVHATKPNVLLILADDLGIECLTTYGGSGHKTPHIDRLAHEGMRFTHCFSNPYCSPSRAQILTGCYPFQNGLTTVLHSKKQENLYLRPSQPSFARQLKLHGYTSQIVGKWHLSLEHKHNTIQAFGFDHYQTWSIFDQHGEKTTRYWNPHCLRDGIHLSEEIKHRYGPDIDLEQHLAFIKKSAKNTTPFCAYYSTCLPHFPLEPTPDSPEKSYRAPAPEHKGAPKNFPAMLAYLDKQIGTMLQTLDELGIAENTIVIFLADNGTDSDLTNPFSTDKTTLGAASIPGGKGTMTDRGTRVPLIVRWPKHIAPKTTCENLIDLSDIFPTLCELTAAPLPKEKLHGRSFAPQLLGKPGSPREWIHIQDKNNRQIRNRHYMLNNKGVLKKVGELWENPTPLDPKNDTPAITAARQSLQTALNKLSK